jgi:hypothetical protein
MSQRENILQQAMQLSREDRAFVADSLERSLNTDGFATTELAKLWATEIERRLAAHTQGDVPDSPYQPALDRIRQRLVDFRSRKVGS